jgi:hypothetical protein
MPRQRLRRAFTDVADAQRIQQALQRGFATGIDGGNEVLRPFGRDFPGLPRFGNDARGFIGALLGGNEIVDAVPAT